jgi:hypothetical protein
VTEPHRADSDIERLLVALMAAPLGVRVVTDLPATLDPDAGTLPILQIEEAPGGAADGPGRLDVCAVDYDAYAAGRPAAKALAEAARQWLLTSAGRPPHDGMWIVRAADVRKPTVLPYDDATDIRRCGGQVRLWLRYRPPA